MESGLTWYPLIHFSNRWVTVHDLAVLQPFILNPSFITSPTLAPQITASIALVPSDLTVSSCCKRDLKGELQPKLDPACTQTFPSLPYCGFQTHGRTHGAALPGWNRRCLISLINSPLRMFDLPSHNTAGSGAQDRRGDLGEASPSGQAVSVSRWICSWMKEMLVLEFSDRWLLFPAAS